jgi:hypothetical protein
VQPQRRRPVASFTPQMPAQQSPPLRQTMPFARHTWPASASRIPIAVSTAPDAAEISALSTRRRDGSEASNRVS